MLAGVRAVDPVRGTAIVGPHGTDKHIVPCAAGEVVLAVAYDNVVVASAVDHVSVDVALNLVVAGPSVEGLSPNASARV